MKAVDLSHLPRDVAQQLAAYDSRKRRLAGSRLVLDSVALLLALALVGMHVDRASFLSSQTRLLMTAGVVFAALLLGVIRLVFQAVRRQTVRDIAYEMEGKIESGCHEHYVTLDDVLARERPDENSVTAEMIAHLEAATIAHSQSFDAARLVDGRPLRRALRRLAVVGLAYVVLACVPGYEFGLMAHRFAMPTRDLAKPSFAKIEVLADCLVVGAGDDVVIQARVSGRVPGILKWFLRQWGTDAEHCVIALHRGPDELFAFSDGELRTMSRVRRDLYLFSRGELRDSFSFRIRHGDAQTAVSAVRVVQQPRVTRLAVHVTPPAYTGLPATRVPAPAEPLGVLPGSTVRIEFGTDRPVGRRDMTADGVDEPLTLGWDGETGTASHDFVFQDSTVLRVSVTDAEGFVNVEPAVVALELLRDEAPAVGLDSLPAEAERVPGEYVAVRAAVSDDFGVAEVALRCVVNPDPEQETAPVEFPVSTGDEKHPKRVDVATVLDLGQLGAVPGDVVSLALRARDTAGADTLSREVRIRVVAFTRGEHERQRLVALRFLQQAFAEIAEMPGGESPGNPMLLPPGDYESIRRRAESAGVVVAPEPSMGSLLDLLEREHHFTLSPFDKWDVRRLHGTVRAAAFATSARTDEDPVDVRAQTLQELSANVMPKLIRYRLGKNVMWRLHGMRDEAARIHDSIRDHLAGGASDEGQARSMKKRRLLYYQSLMDLGEELIGFARSSDALDEVATKDAVGGMNTAAYYLRRGSSGRAQKAATDVAGHLSRLIATLKPALPSLLAQHQDSCRRLGELYTAAFPTRLPGPADNADKRRRVRDWFACELRMMDRELFLPFRPRLLAHTVAAVWRGVDTDDAEAWHALAGRLLSPPVSPDPNIARDYAGAVRMASLAEAQRVRSLERVPNDERELELSLLAAETGIRLGSNSATGPLSPDTEWRHEQIPAGTLCVGLSATSQPAGIAIDRLRKALDAADLDAVRGCIGLLSEALSDESRELEHIGLLATFRATHGGAQGEDATVAELRLLRLRELSRRYVLQAGPAIGELREAARRQQETELLAGVGDVLDRLAPLHAKLATDLAGLATVTPSAEDAQRYVAYEEFARTRTCLSLVQRLVSDSADPATVDEFLAAFPDMGVQYLAGRSDLVASAVVRLEKARQALGDATKSVDSMQKELRAAENDLTRLLRVASAIGDAPEAATIRMSVAALINRVTGIRAAVEPGTAEAGQRALFLLGDTMTDAAGLMSRLTGLGGEATLTGAGFTGGPAGIWQKELRLSAERARASVRARVTWARQLVVSGVLSALDGVPDPGRLDAAAAAADLLFRAARCGLNSEAGVRPPQRDRADRDDPHIAFLMRELEEARRAKAPEPYARITREYLETIADFLRY